MSALVQRWKLFILWTMYNLYVKCRRFEFEPQFEYSRLYIIDIQTYWLSFDKSLNKNIKDKLLSVNVKVTTLVKALTSFK